MKNLKLILEHLINDESGQGATEYILLLVLVVALVILFKGKIMGFIHTKLSDLSSGMGQITTNGG